MDCQSIIEGQEPTSDLSYKWVQANQDIHAIEKPIPLILFNKQIDNRNLDMEFRLIRRLTETQFHIDLLTDYKPNLTKMNRYANIIPYKHSCVELQAEDGENDEIGSYINASWVNSCFKEDKYFIATQGPNQDSFDNFWKMIYYNNVENIIMLCKFKENDKNQCDQYWPSVDDQTKQYNNIQVTLQQEEIIQQHIMKRTLQIKYNKNCSNGNNSSESQENQSDSNNLVNGNTDQLNDASNNQDQSDSKIVYQYQFLAWPDQQTPDENSFPLVQFIIEQMMESFYKNKKSVVHCSAGIGRTGTLISLINIQLLINNFKNKFQQCFKNIEQNNQKIESLSKNPYKEYPQELQDLCDQSGKISIFGIVRRLREQRWGMVHTSEQYSYIYKYVQRILEQISQEIQGNNNDIQQQQTNDDICEVEK